MPQIARSMDDLSMLIESAGKDLQNIQDRLGFEEKAATRIRFPRGYFRFHNHHWNQYGFLKNQCIRRNIGYALMLTDLYRWLLNRTDLYGVPKEMVIKQGICLIGNIFESLTKEVLRGYGASVPFKQRTKNLVAKGIIDLALKQNIDWIWDIRQNEHIFLVKFLEHGVYTIPHYNKAVKTLHEFKDAVKKHSKSGKLGINVRTAA